MATMTTIRFHFQKDACLSQFGLTLAYFSMIGHTRSREDLAFTAQVHNISQQCLRRCSDPSTVGRGITVLTVFTSHLLTPISDHFGPLEEASDLALVSGDKHLFLWVVFTSYPFFVCRLTKMLIGWIGSPWLVLRLQGCIWEPTWLSSRTL